MLKYFIYLFIVLNIYADTDTKHVVFVIDNSGSCWSKGNTNKQQSIDAMMKNTKTIFLNHDVSSILVGKMEECEGATEVNTPFVDNLKDFKNSLMSVKENNGNDSMVSGFKSAQKKMIENNYDGHIYLVGDCDGLDYCGGIENYAKDLMKKNQLTPFTYLFTDGCTSEEKKQWNALVSNLNSIKKGTAATFDYNAIVAKAKKRRKAELKKQYFKKPKFLNKDGSINKGDSPINLWRCVESDGLKWLVINKKEQELNFFMQEPKTNAFYKKSKENILIADFINFLNEENTCDSNNWRLSNIFELTRLTQIGPNKRKKLFPYIKIWPHISSSGSKFNGYRKGIDLNNGNTYSYKENRPYSAFFVSGDIDTNFYEPPIELLTRYKTTKNTVFKSKSIKDDTINDIEFIQVNDVSIGSWVESNTVTIKGINTLVSIEIKDGEFSINGGYWSKIKGKLENNDTLQIRHRAAKTYNTLTETEIIIGGISNVFKSKTKRKTLRKSTFDRKKALGL